MVAVGSQVSVTPRLSLQMSGAVVVPCAPVRLRVLTSIVSQQCEFSFNVMSAAMWWARSAGVASL